MARFILAQMVLHVLRRDRQMKDWFGRIKKRRGAKIARVAVMRRLATIIWHMLKRQEPYRPSGKPVKGSAPDCGCQPPDRDAFGKAWQGRSRGGKQKGCQGPEAEAATTRP